MDFVDRGWLRNDTHKIREAHGRRRHPDGDAVQFSLERRDHKPDRLRGPRGRRDDIFRGAPGSPPILMGEIENALIIRVAVNGRHKAVHDPKTVIEDFGHRSEGVCGAGGIRNHVHRLRIVGFFVYTQAERAVRIVPAGG